MAEDYPKPALSRTPLSSLHESLGARMVSFAGYAMPLQYAGGIIEEHVHTRRRAGLFDVSHMGQIRLAGRDTPAALESLLPADVVGLPQGRQRYAFFTNQAGGILDDFMVTRLDDFLLLVVNAARKAHDIEHLRGHLGPSCEMEVLDERALIALQGPTAARVMAELAPATQSMRFMDAIETRLAGADCYVSRSGYTGEDGFEISVPADAAETLARALLSDDDVAPVGLGARDSLRLEAGLCLYGQDLDADTTPVEAELTWALPKARRPGGERAGGYPGADAIAAQLEAGVRRKRVALLPESRFPVRAGAELADAGGRRAGVVTSGGFGPTLGAPVAMGYVEAAEAKVGTALAAAVRGQPVTVRVAAMPLVPHRYARRRAGPRPAQLS